MPLSYGQDLVGALLRALEPPTEVPGAGVVVVSQGTSDAGEVEFVARDRERFGDRLHMIVVAGIEKLAELLDGGIHGVCLSFLCSKKTTMLLQNRQVRST